MKTCTSCNIEKELNEFYKDGLKFKAQCKSCCKLIKKSYYLNNSVKVLKSHAIYNDKNKENIAKYQKEYYIDNFDYKIESKKKYYSKNRKLILEKKQIYQKNNRETINKYRKQNPEKTIKGSITRRTRFASQTPELTKAQKQQIKEIYQKRNELIKQTGEIYEVHHITPLCEGGLHHPDNLIILSKSQHIEIHRKSSKEKENVNV